ncbi:hypothetical protein ACFLRQ_01240, partial [Bacteroidota bacterium]
MKKLTLFVILFLPFLIFAQDRAVVLQWLENDSLVYFDQAAYIEKSGQTPVFTKIFPWHDPMKAPLVHVKIISVTQLDDKFSEQVKQGYLENTP